MPSGCARRCSQRCARGEAGGAGLRRRHAADLRPRLQAGARRRSPGGIAVTAVPGASAALAALVLSGLPTRPLPLRRVSAAQGRGPAQRAGRAGGGPGDADLLRDRAAGSPRLADMAAGARRPRRGGRARADQAVSRRSAAARSPSSPRTTAGRRAPGEVVGRGRPAGAPRPPRPTSPRRRAARGARDDEPARRGRRGRRRDRRAAARGLRARPGARERRRAKS